jgi:DNA polymerase
MKRILITLDFETYFDSEYSLKKMTTESYVRDPRFEVLGVGVKYDNQPAVWLDEEEFREWASRVQWQHVALCCHHTQFDAFILSHHYNIRPGMLLCTMSMGRALGFARVGLEDLAPKFGLGHKGKELEKAKGKHAWQFSEEEWEEFGGYCRNDVELNHGLLRGMMPGFPRAELRQIDRTIRWFTEPQLVANQEILSTAHAGELERKAKFLARSGVTKDQLRSADLFADLLRKMGEEPPTKQSPSHECRTVCPKAGTVLKSGKPHKCTPKCVCSKPCNKLTIYAFAQKDPGFVALQESPREEIRFLCEARLAITSNIVESRTERLLGVARRGAVPMYLKYCGAHTHRWSGGDKMNPQNFNRGGALRRALEAPPGKKIVVADLSQIEARKLAWVAGETLTLDIFRRNDALNWAHRAEVKRLMKMGVPKKHAKEQAKQTHPDGDFYSDVGSTFYGKKLTKDDTPDERQNSKSMVLGLGFSMGDVTFGCNLLKGFMGAKPVQFTARDVEQYGVGVATYIAEAQQQIGFDGRTKYERIVDMPLRLTVQERFIHFAVTQYFVRRFRAANPRVVQYWKACDQMLGVMADGGAVKFGCLFVGKNKIVKPSGLALHYPGLRRAKNGQGFVYFDGREQIHMYGGKLCENIVQSLARDVIAEHVDQIEAAGYKTVTTTHDEVPCLVEDARAQECLDFMIATMLKAPSWCSDLPLNAEGGFAQSYADAK